MLRFVGLMRVVVAVVLVSVAGSAFAFGGHEKKRIERAEIAQLEDKWRSAQLSEDTSTMDRLLADEFLGVTAAGQVVTKTQQLDRMRSRHLVITRLDISDTKIKISGNLAVVTSLAQIEGTAEGTPLRGAFRYTRVYHRVGRDGWKITNFEATHVGNGGGLPRPVPTAAPRANAGGPPAASTSSSPAFQAVSGSLPPRS